MKSILLYGLVAWLLSFTKLHAQPVVWHPADENAYTLFTASGKAPAPQKFTLQKVDLNQLRSLFLTAPKERIDGKFTKGIPLSIPLPDQATFSAAVAESPIWDAAHTAQFSHIKTYLLSDPATQSIKGRITLTPEGISGILFSASGDVYINPVNFSDPGTHVIDATRNETNLLPCGVKADAEPIRPNTAKAATIAPGRRTCRLCHSCHCRIYCLGRFPV